MEERLRFVLEAEEDWATMSELCAAYGISRKTGYKWRGRYRGEGPRGLHDRSRAPHHPGHEMAPAVVEAVVALRRRHPSWGPRKLRAWLDREHPEVAWPAPSTIGEQLRRDGLVSPRPRRRRTPPDTAPFRDCLGPNDVWSTDFKGWFRTADGARCEPFTLIDGFSRTLLDCRQLASTGGEAVRPRFERAFRRFGLPRAIRSDNGPPFASRALVGLSRLSVWWITLGITPERITPGKPQENGRHERFHLTLDRETAAPPAANLAAQQRRFDRFRQDYNHDRPHQALGFKTPSDFYQPSPRPYPEHPREPDYPAGAAIRRVRHNGEIKWRGRLIFVSGALSGQPLALVEDADGWQLCFCHLDLGHIDPLTFKLTPSDKARGFVDNEKRCPQAPPAQHRPKDS